MSPKLCVLFFFLAIVASGTGIDDCSPMRCSTNGTGPIIRFPFRHKSRHPQHCGYDPSFDLYCDQHNKTVMELPHSLKFTVYEIKYVSQKLVLVYEKERIFERLRHLKLSINAHFRILYKHSLVDYSVLNCSPNNALFSWSSCRNDTNYQIKVVPDYVIDPPITYVSCTKLYTLPSLPLSLYVSKAIYLEWLEPACGLSCESQGKICSSSSNNTSTGHRHQLLCDNQPMKNQGDKMKTRLLISGEVLASIFVVGILIALYGLYLWNRAYKEHQSKIEIFLKDYKSHKPTRFSYADIKKITKDFKEQLGEGRYGIVYKGMVSSEIYVAVKVLNNSIGNGEEFINEVAIIGTIHHVNVVRMLGYCADGFNLALVYEFLPNGTLEKFVFQEGNRKGLVDPKKIQDISLGIAKGIGYLHQGCDIQILHFDIKPNNILLDRNYNPKICDFGLAKLCSKDQSVVSMTFARGTMGFIAPEVMSRTFGRASYKSDVYSFGMVLLEMVGRNKSEDDEMHYWRAMYDQLRQEVISVHIEDDDSKIVSKLTIIALWCIQWYPIHRPSMKEVLKMLEGDISSLTMPPNPFHATNASNSPTGMLGRRHQTELELIAETE